MLRNKEEKKPGICMVKNITTQILIGYSNNSPLPESLCDFLQKKRTHRSTLCIYLSLMILV